MRKVRSFINIALGSLIAALGLTGCEPVVEYGVPPEKGEAHVDTTVHDMYSVPTPGAEVILDNQSGEDDK